MKEQILLLLRSIDQLHLAQGLETLTLQEQAAFLEELRMYESLIPVQKALIGQKKLKGDAIPYHLPEQEINYDMAGREWVRSGKVGCLILAGGQATRLGCEGPKGVVPVTPISGQTLFHVLAEKVRAASDWSGKSLPLAVMTSKQNYGETLSFFQEHEYFGIPSVSLFSQGELPLLDERGNWFLEKAGKLALGPDGNGHALRHFVQSGIWQEWQKQGIEHVSVIFVDNPLANPFDFSMVGLAVGLSTDSVIKAIDRQDANEPMGVLVIKEGKICVVEYFELTESEQQCTLSSTGMFCLSMSFIEKISRQDFPLHLAWKKDKRFGLIGKCERFLFDLLPLSESSVVCRAQRSESYAPLKNKSGDRSLETVQQALLSHHKMVYEKLTGTIPSLERFELASCFEYASQEEALLLKEYPLSSDKRITVAMLREEKR